MTEGLDPVSMLTDDATVAQWNNEGLPGDKMSTQNATILINCEWKLHIYLATMAGFTLLAQIDFYPRKIPIVTHTVFDVFFDFKRICDLSNLFHMGEKIRCELAVNPVC